MIASGIFGIVVGAVLVVLGVLYFFKRGVGIMSGGVLRIVESV